MVDPISPTPFRGDTRDNSEEAVSTSIPVEAVNRAGAQQRPVHVERPPSAVSRDALQSLRAHRPERVEAVLYVRGLLLQAARFEVGRRRLSLPQLGADRLEAIARESAEAALNDVLARLDEVGADRCFSTWVYKFAIVDAAARVRALAWQSGEASCERDGRAALQGTELRVGDDVEERKLISFLKRAIDEVLSPHERHVLVALALSGVPIDVLAERLGSTRAGVYETLRQSQAKLRGWITARRDLESET